jgi:hypothetical protein
VKAEFSEGGLALDVDVSQALFSFGTPRRRENGCRVARRRRSDYGPVSP